YHFTRQTSTALPAPTVSAPHPQSASPETRKAIHLIHQITGPTRLPHPTELVSYGASPGLQQPQARHSRPGLGLSYRSAPQGSCSRGQIIRKPPIRLLILWTCCVTRSRLSLSPSFLNPRSSIRDRFSRPSLSSANFRTRLLAAFRGLRACGREAIRSPLFLLVSSSPSTKRHSQKVTQQAADDLKRDQDQDQDGLRRQTPDYRLVQQRHQSKKDQRRSV
ncbi:hypothetical protein CPAR01_15370, partial [Colletotrichum paranaense]